MEIKDLEKRHIEEAAALAAANYDEERQFVKALPREDRIPVPEALAGNGLGVAAFEGGRMVGFLCCVEPFENVFRATDVRGVFSPMGANGAVRENRGAIYAAMYQAAGAKWVRAGAVSHAVCLYAHDLELQRQFFSYGFGMRCVDAERPAEPIGWGPCPGYTFEEVTGAGRGLIYPLHLAMYGHYRESPFFMNRTPETREEFLAGSKGEDARFFAARHGGSICAYLQISHSGETFIAAGDTYRHITGAYCLPEHRGRGVYQGLLDFAIDVLRSEGCTRLGVDYESINPAGRGFWRKYFAEYTYGVVRRVDERILDLKGTEIL